MQIFSGSSNSGLAKQVAELMGSKMGEVEISQFANGEIRVWVKEKKLAKQVVVVQSLSSPTNEHVIEFCLLCDALHREGAREITAVIPWMGYSKQDKEFRPGEPLSAKVMAQVLQTAKLEKIITFDLHNRATLGFFEVPIVELSAKPLLIDYFRKKVGEQTVVVAPDAGSAKASTSFAQSLGLSVVYVDKRRDLESGKVTIMGMSQSVAGREVILVDDNVFTGATLLSTAKELKKAGAKSIRVGLTHHLYVPGVQEKLEQSEINEIVVTDTIQGNRKQELGIRKEKLKVLSVAPLIVDELAK